MSPIQWHRLPGLPAGPATVLSALGFAPSSAEQLERLSDIQWLEAIEFSDRSGLTLLLAARRRENLPESIRRRTDSNFEANSRRIEKLKREYFEIAARFESLGICHILLKGFLQAPHFVPSPLLRAQYDLDLLCSPESVHRARQALLELGFESMSGDTGLRADHLPAMARKTGWLWKGDYFDPEMPPVVELHFRLWDPATERFQVEGTEQFPARSAPQILDRQPVPGFCIADQLGYSALHALRHLLRGDLKACHVYELAFFMEKRRTDDAFWRGWADLHSPALRGFQAISLVLAHRWFGSALPDAVRVEAEKLPAPLRRWLQQYAGSPILSRFQANKDELWLHLAMLSGAGNKMSVLRRRLLPLNLPGEVEAVFVPEQKMTYRLRLLKRIRYGRFVLSRILFHARSLASILIGAFRWRRWNNKAGVEELD